MLIEKRSGRRLMNQINVVPYIDVLLVLLVIFMVTAPLINPGQIELPSVGKTSAPPVAPMEVSVRTDRTLWLRDRDKGAAERKVTRDQLVAAQKVEAADLAALAADRAAAIRGNMVEVQRIPVERIEIIEPETIDEGSAWVRCRLALEGSE